MSVQLPLTANPPHRFRFERGVIIFTRIARHLYDLSLLSRGGECHFLGRIEQKSDAARSLREEMLGSPQHIPLSRWGSPP